MHEEECAGGQGSVAASVLKCMADCVNEANEYAESFGLGPAEAAFYAYFTGIRKTSENTVLLGLKGKPFVLRHDDIVHSIGQNSGWPGFFTDNDLEKAVNDDFLDAARGSTDNRKGWKISDVSVPRGESFEEARMTYEDVRNALEKGTVIFNAAGAHIPKLAGPSLACSDATYLPCALNLYVTQAGKRTSAPPHTDKQDVVVVQTSGRKHWKVYAPPDPAAKPNRDMYARGKGDDSLPLYALESDLQCELLLDTVLNPGDALFVPAAFPHTTSTVVDDSEDNGAIQETSIHLTLNIDHHIWELDYLSARRLALRRANVVDTALGKSRDEENRYEGKANQLPKHLREDLFRALPLGLLDNEKRPNLIGDVVDELKRISKLVDEDTFEKVEDSIWRDTVERLCEQGVDLYETHRDMYLAALEEGETRKAEEAITAHLESETKRVMSPERVQRLSLFRVKRYYDSINKSKQDLLEWSYAGVKSVSGEQGGQSAGALPSDWAFSMPVKVGDQVEADLGGAFFPATVVRASGGTFDVNFFDGDRETNLDRSQIKLLTPPAVDSGDEPANMTPKELKRWRKQQQKKLK